MHSSSIKNVNNSIMVLGYQGLAYSNISNVYNLYIDATYGFQDSIIDNIHNIKINGTNSLSGSIITSNLTIGSGNNNDYIYN